MKINLKDAFLLDRYEKELSLLLDVGEDLNTLADFKKSPSATFSIKGKYGLVVCETKIDAEFTTYCCRCLAQVDDRLSISNSKRIITDPLKEDEETILIDKNYFLDCDEEARNQIILDFPDRFLCSEDCKGLCPVCGCNLNEQQCACEN